MTNAQKYIIMTWFSLKYMCQHAVPCISMCLIQLYSKSVVQKSLDSVLDVLKVLFSHTVMNDCWWMNECLEYYKLNYFLLKINWIDQSFVKIKLVCINAFNDKHWWKTAATWNTQLTKHQLKKKYFIFTGQISDGLLTVENVTFLAGQ